MKIKTTLKKSLDSTWIILKFIIPIYLLADLLYYYDILKYIAFILEPITTLIGLPSEATLALISGITLNLYAGIAFAAPLDLSSHEWTILAIFLGIAHSLIVESAVMKQLGLSIRYAYILRIIVAILGAVLASRMPSSWFANTIVVSTAENIHYPDVWVMLWHSMQGALLLSIKIVALVTILIIMMDWIRSHPILQKNTRHISKGFTLASGLVLGITYGAGVLISEAKGGEMSQNEIFVIGTFLLICHALIEDTLLFAMFGANAVVIVTVRSLLAMATAGVAWWYIKTKK